MGGTNSAKRDIRNLLIVIFGGVFFAFAISLFLLNYYNTSGVYFVRNVLLSPQIIDKLSFNDTNSKTGKMTRFVFKEIEFKYYDEKGKKVFREGITISTYTSFYENIAEEKSIKEVTEEIRQLFYRLPPAVLALIIRSADTSDTQTEKKTFQNVEFSNKGDYFRIQLRTTEGSDTWAYFYHPGIYIEAIKHFSGAL